MTDFLIFEKLAQILYRQLHTWIPLFELHAYLDEVGCRVKEHQCKKSLADVSKNKKKRQNMSSISGVSFDLGPDFLGLRSTSPC